MKAFIIGASGLVGSHCAKHFRDNNWEVVGTHFSHATDTTVSFDFETTELSDFFKGKDFFPDVIVHCAALTNVDYCENNREESYRKTVLPTIKIVDFCKSANVGLIYISTDYVFDGLFGPYGEDDLVKPLNVYGEHKLDSENLVSKLDKHLILRVTNVFGEEERSKNFIARLIDDLRNKVEKSLKLPFDQYATPIYAGDIAKMSLLLISDNKTGIYHLGGTDYYNRYQLAHKVKSYFNGRETFILTPVSTAIASQTAVRPLMGGLLNKKFIKEYPEFTFENVDSFISKVLTNEL